MYTIFSILLDYPTQGLLESLHEVEDLVKQGNLENKKEIFTLLNRLKKDDLLSSQEHYVDLFDRTPGLCLNLFEHVHGQSKRRGQALSDLLETYEIFGLKIEDTTTMPDYLPLYLEFLSTQEDNQAKSYLRDVSPVLTLLHRRLQKRKSDYAVIMKNLISYGDVLSSSLDIQEQEGSEKKPTLRELDNLYDEPDAFEGQPPSIPGINTQ